MTLDRPRAAIAAAFAVAFSLSLAAGAAADPSPKPEGLLVTPAPMSDAAIGVALQTDLDDYLKAHKDSEHVSASALTVSLKGETGFINVAAGTTEFGGTTSLPDESLWQIGSNTKAFTAAMILQLEAEHALSLQDTVGKWLPQYRAWSAITIKQLLNMTSGIPSYDDQPAFQKAFAATPKAAIPVQVLVAFGQGSPLKTGYYYSNTAYLLAQLIAEKAGHDSYANQLRKRFFGPLGLSDASFGTDLTPASVVARMPAGYFFDHTAKPMASLVGKDVRGWTTSWMQGAGGIIASTETLTKWVRALYDGRVLAPAQQAELESVVSMNTGKPLDVTTAADPRGFGLGVVQAHVPAVGMLWFYEGGTFGYRMLYMYVPQSGAIVTVGLNSTADKDDIGALFTKLYATLQHAGRV
jgi:D-alanyl-D-alanine carboxypeptidase